MNGCALVTASCVNITGVGGIGATTALKLATTKYSVTNTGGGAIADVYARMGDPLAVS